MHRPDRGPPCDLLVRATSLAAFTRQIDCVAR
jgi:hypothetical protein